MGKFDLLEGDRQSERLVMFSWVPENKTPVKMKMLHGSSLGAVRTLDGLSYKTIQMNSASELEFESAEKAVRDLKA